MMGFLFICFVLFFCLAWKLGVWLVVSTCVCTGMIPRVSQFAAICEVFQESFYDRCCQYNELD